MSLQKHGTHKAGHRHYSIVKKYLLGCLREEELRYKGFGKKARLQGLEPISQTRVSLQECSAKAVLWKEI